jgi:catechol 2,3-dioxygenase-like lactoylglutathione lyase family enzyme
MEDTTPAPGRPFGQGDGMLIDGLNHVAVLTSDTDRLVAFYGEMFGATVDGSVRDEPGFRLTILKIGATSELNVFEIDGNDEASRQTPMFGRGRLDHLALQAASLADFEAIRERLVETGASDGFVTDFGPILSLFFRDPDGLEAEVCIANPDAVAGELHPPGTPARRYHPT